MISKAFNPNPIIKSMSFNNGHLKIEFKKGQVRVYECSSELAYKLFYCKTASEELSCYSNEIKKLCNVADVLNPK